MPRVANAKATKIVPKKPAAKKKTNGYQMPEKIPLGTVLTDLSKQQWRIGIAIGSGGFGDIYCASKADSSKKTDDYPYVVKVEPHVNGPLFVEMHFYMRSGKLADIDAFRKRHGLKILGMPYLVGHGSHDFNQIKHRFVVMPRYGKDIWNLFIENNRKMPYHTIYRLAIQMLDVYEYIHECSYVHGDLKGSNILLGYGKGAGNQAYLVDFGLASRHKGEEFKPNPKKMHDGTIEYTSRDAHQGVPTMRGDLEILGYNLIEWCGFQLPWVADKILGTPVKVQAAKEEFMKNVDASLKKCFGSNACPEPIAKFVNYVTKLKYDEKPNYEKCRKDFLSGLKSLGKSNSGDLEFGSVATSSKNVSPSVKENVKPVGRSVRSPRKRTSDVFNCTQSTIDGSDFEVSPRKPSTSRPRKRIQMEIDESDEEIISYKKARAKPSKEKPITSLSPAVHNDPSIIINNEIKATKNSKGKTYNLNFELDISLDANVVVNVKRKARKTNDKQKKGEVSPIPVRPSIQSTDEIPATDEHIHVGVTRGKKLPVKTVKTTRK